MSALPGFYIRGETLPWHVAQPSHLHAWGYAIHQSCWSGGLVPDGMWAHVQGIGFRIWVWGWRAGVPAELKKQHPERGSQEAQQSPWRFQEADATGAGAFALPQSRRRMRVGGAVYHLGFSLTNY